MEAPGSATVMEEVVCGLKLIEKYKDSIKCVKLQFIVTKIAKKLNFLKINLTLFIYATF